MVQQGLYDPRNEHDACGAAFVVNIKGKKSHDIITQGLQVLINLNHRGAVANGMGDGAGCLIQTPGALFRNWALNNSVTLPPEGQYAAAMVFLPQDEAACTLAVEHFEKIVAAAGQTLLKWREVPTDPDVLSDNVRKTMPKIRQAIIAASPELGGNQDAFERKLYVIRKIWQNEIKALAQQQAGSLNQEQVRQLEKEAYIASLSSRTIVYKGLLLAPDVGAFYKDLKDPLTVSAMALVHQRFSTNTFPSWRLAHPYHHVVHNGEINTVRGNVNWMTARRLKIQSDILGQDLEQIKNSGLLIDPIQSDTACFDDAFGLLTIAGGLSPAHAMAMLIPEAWQNDRDMDPARRAFYEYHAAMMEPWDGPAAIAFTDGRQIGATLDRNGLRPARYIQTDDDLVILASEAGVLPVPEEKIAKKWRLQPGKMLLIDTVEGRIIEDAEIKATLAAEHPYGEWLKTTQFPLKALSNGNNVAAPSSPVLSNNPTTLREKQNAFGYTDEDMKFFIQPMAEDGEDPTGSMGTDTPLAVFSGQQPFFNYFKQTFAQVTNPPIDPIREEMVMSLISIIGPRPNLLGKTADRHNRLEVSQPILTNEELEKIRSIKHSDDAGHAFSTLTLDATWPLEEGEDGLEPALQRLCKEAEVAVKNGHYNIIIISDRGASADHVPIPSLLATSAVHQHLVREGLRTETGLVVETGDGRQVHHFSALAGFGAEAINPYLAFDTIADIYNVGATPEERDQLTQKAQSQYIKAGSKGILKVMSKMGISTYQSYCGAQLFDAIGLESSFVEKYFTGTPTTIEGADVTAIARQTMERHERAFSFDAGNPMQMLRAGGMYAFRQNAGSEMHAWTPKTIGDLQHAVRSGNFGTFGEYTREMNAQSAQMLTLRGLMEFNLAPEDEKVPLDEVEPAREIVKRFATGAMSFGSISREAHTTMAIAMNRIGGKSNTGEGGEEPDRFVTMLNGDSKRSAIKQIASGRFGVTTEYMVNADVLQIKMAQGAKPGEGGQLPGHKVDKAIAKVRHSTPGVGLVSPPPHHDIYSIEDLAQLIHDLKNTNPEAAVSVKLVSEVGVGTVAAGVTKARADHVTIAGYEGGTGASPLTSLTHAGSPWEIGLAETQQTLVRNGLRGRIEVQVDGGLRTGRDVVIGALLGADGFGFATAPLIASGCVMMRKCHLNTCPVGIATQDPVLRDRFTGKPEHIINFFFYIAEEVRGLMADLGFRTVDEMVGRVDKLNMNPAIDHWKAKGVNLSRILYEEPVQTNDARHHCQTQNHHLDKAMDHELIAAAVPAIERREPVFIKKKIHNVHRTVGAMLSGRIATRFGHDGLPQDTIWAQFEGTAGSSFAASLVHGETFELIGDANDYVGKFLSGGRLIVRQPRQATRTPEENIIIGNTVFYGAIAGEGYFNGVAGERFAVRNSGAVAVVEGTGDHGCEYMTGGVVLVLGETGRNFAAGMSGGIAYVYDPRGVFAKSKCNIDNVDNIQTYDEWDRSGQPGDLWAPQLSAKDVHDNGMGDPLRFDEERLEILIARHHKLTGSPCAEEILGNWEKTAPKIVKITPAQYRKALLELKVAA